MGKTLGYARISTDMGQDIDSQKAALTKLGAIVVFHDIGNGSSLDGRDQLEAAIRLLEPGDELLALHPDRLARDTGDLLTIARRIIEKKAVLRIDDPSIVMDGSDIMAEVMLTVFGLVGRLEKHFTKARQRRGYRSRTAQGRLSRPSRHHPTRRCSRTSPARPWRDRHRQEARDRPCECLSGIGGMMVIRPDRRAKVTPRSSSATSCRHRYGARRGRA